MVSPEIVTLSVFITPCTKPTSIHRATSAAWAATTASNSARCRDLGVGGLRVVPGDRVVGQAAQQVEIPRRGDELEAAHPQVAARDPGEHGAGQDRLATNRPAGRDDGEGSGRGDAQGVHRLADDVLAQHRPDRGQPVAAAREGGPARALEVEVAQASVGRGQLAEQERAAVTEPRGEPAELVAGVRLGDGSGAGGDEVADQQSGAVGAAQGVGVEAEIGGERVVQRQEPGVGGGLGLPGQRQLPELPREAVVQGHGRWGYDAHADEPTAPL